VVDVAVVDATGALVASAGDPEQPAAFRSSAKPLQARASLEAGWTPADDRALAIACASHNGEQDHIAVVRTVLSAAGIDASELRCPPDVPLYLPAVMGVDRKSSIYHNCSGKHAAMLGACKASRWPFADYRDPDHPLQRAVQSIVRGAIGETRAMLVDGCGVPTFVAPLRALARGLLAVTDGPESAAMRAHPFLVAGTDRLDTDLMAADPGVLSKGGAEGLECLAVDGLGIAVKVRDGSARARGPAVLLSLEQLGLTEPGFLMQHREPPVFGGGRPVGTLRAHGALERR
jgi:L-asparaginase II